MASHFKVFTVSVLVLLISSTLSSQSDFWSNKNNNSESAVLENHHHLQLGCVCDAECDRIQEDDCPWGLTLDFCGCCLVCSRGEGEPCGGALGSCAHGLYCVSTDASSSSVVVDHGDSVDDEEGRRCSASPGPILGCNNDNKSLTRAERYGCYFSGGNCRCGNFTSCHHHELDYFLFDTEEACRSRIELLTANSGGIGGSGDVSSGRLLINRERDKAEDHHHGGCSRVKCPEVLNCPSDSYRLPTNIHPESNECCPTVNKCQCNPVLECPKPECPPGWTQQLILNATGEPGRCCPLLECSPSQQKFGGEHVCSYDGIQYNQGDTWTHLEDCTECSCSGDGIVSCNRIKCDIPAQCLSARAPAGSCCPVCAGCTTSRGKVYNNSDVWEEDACTLCECDEGRVKCHATMCQSQCENPIYVPGECCPRCAPPLESERNDERNCHGDDGMTKCEKNCPFGFAKDNNGCWTCDCNKCPSLALLQCHLDCPLEMDDFGCPICSCRSRTRNSSNNNNNTNGRRKSSSSSEWFEKNRAKKRANKNRLNKPNRPSFPSVTMVPTSSSSNKVNTLVGKGLGKTCHSVNGKDEIVRLEGEEWSDGCRQCVCKFGREFCTLISCSPPECEHPIFYPGDCCPRCPDEDIALEHVNNRKDNNNNVTICPASGSTNHPHIEGEQWELSPCLKCTCHRGLTLCATPNCPPAPCQAGDLISPDGGITSCCPRCKSQRENNNNSDDKLKMVTPNVAAIQARASELRSVPLRGTLKVDMTDDMDLPEINNHKKGKKNCYSDNFQLEYPDGEAWKVGPCQSCICQDGRIECFSSSGNCPRLDCERPALAKNQCCPICLDYGGRVKTEMNCTVSGSNDTWLHGQSWMADKCTRCVCNAPLVQCTRIICSISCRKPLLYVEDECCPICPPDEDEGLHRGGFLEPYYCNVVIGVLLCLTSLLILYVLSHMYQRRRRRQIRLSDRSSCSFSKPSSTGSSCSSEDSSSDYYQKKKKSSSSCIGKKYPCSSVSRSSSNNSCHGSSESSSGGGGGGGASAEEKLLCPSNV